MRKTFKHLYSNSKAVVEVVRVFVNNSLDKEFYTATIRYIDPSYCKDRAIYTEKTKITRPTKKDAFQDAIFILENSFKIPKVL